MCGQSDVEVCCGVGRSMHVVCVGGVCGSYGPMRLECAHRWHKNWCFLKTSKWRGVIPLFDNKPPLAL